MTSPLTNVRNLKGYNTSQKNFPPKKKSKTENVVKKNIKTAPPKYHRMVFQAEKNLAPSVTYANEKLSIQIEEHANLRVQLFYITALALYKKAERTGKPPSDVKVSIRRARVQVGQGDRDNHAAHANASANVEDNLKDCYKHQINQQGLTPKKRALLSKAKKIPDSILDLIEKHHSDKDFVDRLIDKYWSETSLITGTPLELTLNATHKLPRGVNLGCDLRLELRVRPYMEVLYTRLMKGEMTPNEGTSLFQNEVIKHFEEQLKDLKEKKALLKDTSSKVEQLITCKKQLFYHTCELRGTKAANYLHLKKDFEQENDIERPIDVDKTFNLFA